MALPVVKDFISAVKEKAFGEEVIGSLSPGQALVGVVHRELTRIMGGANEGINFNTQPPAIILMAGLQGAGKTTTVGKLGKFLKENHKKKVLVVSCDVYRPAAIEQLKSVAGQAGVDFFPSTIGEKPEAIALAALDWAKRHYHDVLLVDTAGIAKMIKRLGDEKVKFNLALSLHAANDEKRNTIMPINEQNNIEVLIDALTHFQKETGNDVTFEYILLNGVNDSPKDADELAELCKKLPFVKVNLIEYNKIKEADFSKTDKIRRDNFVRLLEEKKVIANVRRSRGKDIDAACGQLANKN